LGGGSFKIRLDTTKLTVGEAKGEIARVQGTEVARQDLYRIAVREDGKAVRENDAEPELLDGEFMALEEGAVVAMAVKELPLLWRTFPQEYVELSEGGTVATQLQDHLSYIAGYRITVVLDNRTAYHGYFEFLRLETGFELFSSWINDSCYGSSRHRSGLIFMRWNHIDLGAQGLNGIQRPKLFFQNNWK
jgi:hypothetical protein